MRGFDYATILRPSFLGVRKSAWHNDPPFVTLGVLPPRRHVVSRDSVGVRSSGSGLKSECADIFHQSLISGYYAILTSP